jgi:hypothetical protein
VGLCLVASRILFLPALKAICVANLHFGLRSQFARGQLPQSVLLHLGVIQHNCNVELARRFEFVETPVTMSEDNRDLVIVWQLSST